MSDHCCWACRSQFGCVNTNCQHHLETRRTQDANDRARNTIRRPTEDQAIWNVMHENRRR